MKDDLQAEVINDLEKRKKISRDYLRRLSPTEKISRLVDLQERYYQMLVVREENGGRPIPKKWQKWHAARYDYERQS